MKEYFERNYLEIQIIAWGWKKPNTPGAYKPRMRALRDAIVDGRLVPTKSTSNPTEKTAVSLEELEKYIERCPLATDTSRLRALCHLWHYVRDAKSPVSQEAFEAEARRLDLERLLSESVAVTAAPFIVGKPEVLPAAQKNKGGRPREYDWDGFDREMLRRADLHGLEDRAVFTKEMLQWCIDTWGNHPAESAVRAHIGKRWPK